MDSFLSHVWAALLLLGGCIETSTAPQDAQMVANFYQGRVAEVVGPLQFKLDCCDEILELALVRLDDTSTANVAALNSFLVGLDLQCTAYNAGQKTADGHLVPVWCNTSDRRILSGQLISKGFVAERCDISANQFGTC